MESGQQQRFAEPFPLNPAGRMPRDAAERARHSDPIAPYHDADFDAWLGPFLMGLVNTRAVRPSKPYEFR